VTLLNPYRFGGGGGASGVDLRDGAWNTVAIDPADATASFTLAAGGTATGVDVDELSTGSYPWKLSGNAGDYEVRATMVSGSVTSGNTNVWTNLAAGASWTKTRTILNSSSCTFLLEIRPAGGGAVIDSCTITLTATVEI
jgi:hypothetical protein